MRSRWFPDSEVRIDATPSVFVLRDDFDEVTLPATVWVTLDGRFEAVNDRPPETPSVIRVEIFKPSPWDPDVSRSELLRRFLRFGLRRFIEGVMFKVRPIVRFGSLQGFAPMLCGFQRDLFEWAALNAGARAVRFDPGDIPRPQMVRNEASAKDHRPASGNVSHGMDYWRKTFVRLNRNPMPR